MPAEETWGRRPDATAYVRGKLAEGAAKRGEIKRILAAIRRKRRKTNELKMKEHHSPSA